MSDLLDDATSASSGDDARSPKPRIWQSLSEFEGKLPAQGDAPSDEVANFVGREFPTDDFDQLDSVDRRRFFQILGASAALAGASSCRWEKETILPHTRPEETIPGKAKHYASVLDMSGAARPVMVTSYDGRPVKVEPNTNVGAGTDVYSQAEVLSFYDPDRSRGVLARARAAWSSRAGTTPPRRSRPRSPRAVSPSSRAPTARRPSRASAPR